VLRKARTHKYKERHKNAAGEWVYTYDEPAGQPSAPTIATSLKQFAAGQRDAMFKEYEGEVSKQEIAENYPDSSYEQEWINHVRDAARAGHVIPARALDNLHALEPHLVTSLFHDYERSIPADYVPPNVRQQNKEYSEGMRAARKAGKAAANKSAAGTVGDALRKARKGESAAGHKYESRTWNQSAGHWDYHYRAKDDPNNLSADHIFAIFNGNKRADIGHVYHYIEWASKESGQHQAVLMNRLDQTVYGIHWALRTGRLSGTTSRYLNALEGKELAKVVAAVMPHVHTSGDVPAVLQKMWGSDEKQKEMSAQLRALEFGESKALKAILK